MDTLVQTKVPGCNAVAPVQLLLHLVQEQKEGTFHPLHPRKAPAASMGQNCWHKSKQSHVRDSDQGRGIECSGGHSCNSCPVLGLNLPIPFFCPLLSLITPSPPSTTLSPLLHRAPICSGRCWGPTGTSRPAQALPPVSGSSTLPQHALWLAFHQHSSLC